MISRAARLTAGLGVLVVLAACTGDDGGPATLPDLTPPPATTTPAPTPTPTVQPPVESADTHEYSEAGVEAFTRYAIDVINHAYQTNDVTYLQAIMTPACETCANTVDNLETMAADGGRVDGGQIEAERISPQKPTEGVRPGSVVDVIVTASSTYDHSNRIIESRDEEPLQLVFFLTREGSQWKLDGVTYGVER